MSSPQITPAPIQPGQFDVSALPGEPPAKPPWHPRVSGIAGFLCGPLAAGIIAFINLRRLNYRRRAVWTLILTIVGSAIIGLMIVKLPDAWFMTLAKLIGNFVSPLLYPLLQWRPFEEWAGKHPDATRDNGLRSSGWAVLGMIGFLAIAVGAAFLFSQGEEARDIRVGYQMPETAKVGETFVFIISVKNTADQPQLLRSLDFGADFLEGVTIRRTTPAFKRSEPVLLPRAESYIFFENIPAQGEIEIEVEGRALKPGVFPLHLDVCIKTGVYCSSFDLDKITAQ